MSLIPTAVFARPAPAKPQAVQFLAPHVITKSTVFPGGSLRLPDVHGKGDGGAIVIKGDNISLDFGGRILAGTSPTALPDTRRGTGLFVAGKNITIKNVRVRGYKIGLFARNAPGLRIINGDFSYNWKQHLQSTPEREDLADWMSFHHNEQNEWLRYGAGVYLDRCDKFAVQNCRVTGGQNGLLVTCSNHGQAWNNDFSFLSGIGLGLYRSSGNRVLHNKLDWCVRGYSHGVYNRGQDSAAILAFEQCSNNTFAYNSATHGGDGFFLWAGQTTMDTGNGGCNDNLIYGNDFSHSPTNGVEVTFSRNVIANNLIMECWHGIWGGYSYNTRIVGNVFGFNSQSIAIEHGQHNDITDNRFFRDNAGIRLWQNPTQDPNWGYPKHHDTQSHDYRIARNYFDRVGNTLFDTKTSTNVTIVPNNINQEHFAVNDTPTMEPSGKPVLSSETDPVSYADRFQQARDSNPYQPKHWQPFASFVGYNENRVAAPATIAGGQNSFLNHGALRGRRYILVDEWGPYDFRSPQLWPREVIPSKPNTQTFEALGPPGQWKLKTAEGATLSAQTGTVPGFVTVTYGGNATPGMAQNVRIALEYTGEQTTDFRGVVSPAGTAVPFGYSHFSAPIAWTVKWYQWDAKAAGNTPEGWPTIETVSALANGITEPIAQTTTDRLDLAGNGAFFKTLPPDHYATVANGTFSVAPGDYVLETTTDDGCFVWVDEKPVITTAWKYQGPTLYSANLHLLAGEHTIRVCHFQIDGYAALQIKLRPR